MAEQEKGLQNETTEESTKKVHAQGGRIKLVVRWIQNTQAALECESALAMYLSDGYRLKETIFLGVQQIVGQQPGAMAEKFMFVLEK